MFYSLSLTFHGNEKIVILIDKLANDCDKNINILINHYGNPKSFLMNALKKRDDSMHLYNALCTQMRVD